MVERYGIDTLTSTQAFAYGISTQVRHYQQRNRAECACMANDVEQRRVALALLELPPNNGPNILG
jgi:hypothetical protein